MYNRMIYFSLFSDKFSLIEDEIPFMEDEVYLGNNTEGVNLYCHYRRLTLKKTF